MPVTASEIFDFIEQHRTVFIERHEIGSTAFAALRRHLRSILLHLAESDDSQAREICGTLRAALSEWLTVPIAFDDAILDAVETLGDPLVLGVRWGNDIRSAYEAALNAAEHLPTENPMRVKLRSVISDLRSQGRGLKIFCHRRARLSFDSLFSVGDGTSLEDSFLHSIGDYRNCRPFDVLIKVGPLRSRGWGAVPDSLLTAPRFDILAQFVWSGCSDEPGFGYDPVAPLLNSAGNGPGSAATNQTTVLGNQISKSSRIIHYGEPEPAFPTPALDMEEFQIFARLTQPGEKQRVLLAQVDEEHGILYPRYARVLSYDRGDVYEPIATRYAGETLAEGMFIIQPLLGEIDVGGFRTAEGRYSAIWKDRLREELRINPEGLCRILRNKGIALLHLRACLENWAKPATGVIHAPQHVAHFQILIEVLAVCSDLTDVSWWQHAWREIRISRGEAIQAGFHEQEIVQGQSIQILQTLLPDIRKKAETGAGFHLLIPSGSEFSGAFLFLKVVAIEAGFLAPETELKVIRDLDSLEQWRVA